MRLELGNSSLNIGRRVEKDKEGVTTSNNAKWLCFSLMILGRLALEL